MKESVLIQDKKRIKFNVGFLKKDIVFTISLLFAVASCFVYTPKLEYIDFRVLLSLFSLMLVIKALEELRFLDKIAIRILNKSRNSQSVSAILIFLCFFSSMLVTNDVALLTFVPLTLVVSRKTNIPNMETIILQTIAANIGSSVTPMGNPQNLFIYSFYGIKPIAFFATVLFTAVLGFCAIYYFILRLQKKELKVEIPPLPKEDWKKTILWVLVIVIIIASILGLLNYRIAFMVTLFAVVLLDIKLFIKIDYFLLLTFICFFIFIGNISSSSTIHAVASTTMNDSTSVFFNSILISQFISNVPAAILLAEFTSHWKPLLLGVNIGGLGTLIASLASVISYKLFIQENPQSGKKYLVKFSIYNLSFLAFLTLIQFMIAKIFKVF